MLKYLVVIFISILLNASDKSNSSIDSVSIDVPEACPELDSRNSPPATPTLHAIKRMPSIPDLNLYDLNNDGIIDEEEERICNFVMGAHFANRDINPTHILTSLRRNIRERSDSPNIQDRISIMRMARQRSYSHVDTMNEKYISDLVLQSTKEALSKVESELEEHKKELNNRVPKRKAACKAGISSALTALVGIAATLVVHFTQGNNCGSSE